MFSLQPSRVIEVSSYDALTEKKKKGTQKSNDVFKCDN